MGVVVREKVEGSGQWWVYTYYKGKRTAKKIGDKRTAAKFARAMREQLKLGELPRWVKDVRRLEKLYPKFERIYMATAVKESTRCSYEMSFRVHILPELGGLRVDEISRARMEEFVALLVEKGLAKDSIRLILAALSVLFNWARDRNVMDTNPASGLAKFY